MDNTMGLKMHQIELAFAQEAQVEIEDSDAKFVASNASYRRTGKLIVGNCVDVMRSWSDGIVNLTVTSPPYDTLRDYNGYNFPFLEIAEQLYRVTAPGGVLVWVVGDRINGGRSLTSFRQAIQFQEIGFTAHDVMIYQKKNTPFMRSNATPTPTR